MPGLNSTLLQIESIVHRHDTARIEELIGVLSDNVDDRVRWAAAWALGRLDAERAIPALERVMSAKHRHSSAGAAQALMFMGPDRVRRASKIVDRPGG